MEIVIPYKPKPLTASSTQLLKTLKSSGLVRFPAKYGLRVTKKKTDFSVSTRLKVVVGLLANNDGGYSQVRLTQYLRVGAGRIGEKIGESVKKEIGFDSKEASARVDEYVGRVKDSMQKGQQQLDRFKTKKGSNGRVYVAIQDPRIERERRELTDSFMEALIPEPSPGNIDKFKRNIWRKTTPKGLKLKRFIEWPDGTLVHDSTYVGENAWEEDLETTEGSLKQLIDRNARIQKKAKKKLSQDLGVSGEFGDSVVTWRERLATWKEMLERENLLEQLNSSKANYVVEFDMKDVEKSLRKDVIERTSETEGTGAHWISKKWW